MKLKETKIHFPVWAICLEAYGHDSSLSQEDVEVYLKWAKEHPDSTVVYQGEEFFSSSPAFGLPTTCLQATLVEYEDEE